MSRNLVLFSGGFDSVVMLNDFIREAEEDDEFFLLHFNYGQKSAKQESMVARKWADKFGIPLKVVNIELPGHSSLYEGEDVTDYTNVDSQYVPMRNIVFLSYALSYAEILGCDTIYSAIIGGGGYPDTTAAFMDEMEILGEIVGINIKFPFRYYSKRGVADGAQDYDLQWDDFFSCNTPTDGNPCGICPDCEAVKSIMSEWGK